MEHDNRRTVAKRIIKRLAVAAAPDVDPSFEARSETQMGPLASERRVEAISHLVEDARNRGATIAAGGQRVGKRGFFYPLTVMTAPAPPEGLASVWLNGVNEFITHLPEVPLGGWK